MSTKTVPRPGAASAHHALIRDGFKIIKTVLSFIISMEDETLMEDETTSLESLAQQVVWYCVVFKIDCARLYQLTPALDITVTVL